MKIKLFLCKTILLSLAWFVLWNDYEINGNKVFLSFILKKLILIIKHNGKVNFHLFNKIIYFPFMMKCTSFVEQKGARYIQGNIYFDIIVSGSLSSTKPCLKFLICFAREIKGFYQISWGNEVDFTDMMNVSQKNLGARLKFQKAETRSCWWKSNTYNDSNIFLSLENHCTILLEKEKTWKHTLKTNCELLQNHSEKQYMPFETTVNCYQVKK